MDNGDNQPFEFGETMSEIYSFSEKDFEWGGEA